MKKLDIGLPDVQAVYDGPEGVLWELIMGEQIHVGGFKSSMELATKAGIKAGMHGLDICSALGAGCRFLVKNFGVTMTGQDATRTMLQKAGERVQAEGFSGKIEFQEGDVTTILSPNSTFDFVWGEDTWCYVTDKGRVISEAARVLKPGGILAFTDWIEGPAGLSDEEANRVNSFMKFPYMENQRGYEQLIRDNGMELISSDDLTEEFAGYVDFYIKMLTEQLTFDALKIIGDDMELFQAMGGEMGNMAQIAHEGKMGRGRFVARKV
ncbi:MAG: methyltransferase domain-containing protein [Calditrichaeota bacterium]|nr:methyltransferase domain-containing protein [Calditrichota bacterium]MBT7615942.1 methyltransferase domain-containing protein [Calditrichota bacterium]MBT7789011.1 methyltransferase domain-containing protein [Calditrichota bacterium]